MHTMGGRNIAKKMAHSTLAERLYFLFSLINNIFLRNFLSS